MVAGLSGLKARKEPTKYWLSTVREKRSPSLNLSSWSNCAGVSSATIQDLKQEVGLGHFRGHRGWRGFHHHASLCIAAYGLLISERETSPPQHIVPPGVVPGTCLSQGLQTRRLCHYVPNDTFRTPLRRCADASSSPSSQDWKRCPCCTPPQSVRSRQRNNL